MNWDIDGQFYLIRTTLGNLVFQGHSFDFLGEQLIIQDLLFFSYRRIKIADYFGMIFILLQCFTLFYTIYI